MDQERKNKYWSAEITRKSNALDLEEGVFTWKDPRKIARSLKKSAELSTRRKAQPFQSAMSMINFYINRAGSNLDSSQRKILNQAKDELRLLFHKKDKAKLSPNILLKLLFPVLFNLIFHNAVLALDIDKITKTAKKDIYALPHPNFDGLSFEETLHQRRSFREYADQALSLDELSQLLFAAYGVTGIVEGIAHRTSPSAGALYPFEIFFTVQNVTGLRKGLYYYMRDEHNIRLVKEGNFADKITKAAVDQQWVGDAPVTFLLTAIFQRTAVKYGRRATQYVYIEAGHIGQNIHLQAISLGLGSVSVGAFDDDQLNQIIGIDGKMQKAVYIIPVGKK